MQKEVVSLVIIGSGPAGYTAAIYAARADLSPTLYEGFFSGTKGGQLMTTTEIENFPGFPEKIPGPELMEKMHAQAKRFNTRFLAEDVTSVDFSIHPFLINGSKTSLMANAVIIATGATAKRLEVPGVEAFWQKGVSSCAVCDGAAPIFRNKDLFVIGGGDTAVEEALFLTKFASKVYLVHRRDTLKASKVLADRALHHPKIIPIWNSVLVAIEGDTIVRSVRIQNNLTQEQKSLPAAGVFLAIGHQPNTGFLKNQIDLLESGYIKVQSGTTKTSVPGVFAAGDVMDPVYRQAIVAAGSGCMASMDAEKWLSEQGKAC